VGNEPPPPLPPPLTFFRWQSIFLSHREKKKQEIVKEVSHYLVEGSLCGFSIFLYKQCLVFLLSLGQIVKVFVVDNYFTGRKRNIEQWLGHENFEMLHHDIGTQNTERDFKITVFENQRIFPNFNHFRAWFTVVSSFFHLTDFCC
jgi:hypothetical protein